MGIGLYALPHHARVSSIFTEEHLHHLSLADSIPTEDALSLIKASPDVKRILDEFDDDPSRCWDALHGLAQQYLMMDEVERALAIVFL